VQLFIFQRYNYVVEDSWEDIPERFVERNSVLTREGLLFVMSDKYN